MVVDTYAYSVASLVLCVQVLPFDDNVCVNEPCLNFEHCVSEQRFGNASSVVGSDSVMLRPLHMSSTITCRCSVGFTGRYWQSIVISVLEF